MSLESKGLMSSQNIPQEATQQKKLPKIAARYIELEQFKDSDHHRGYFCYNCAYFVKPHHCAIVTDEGMDIMGRSSGVIAPHGLCSVWIPNEKEIHGKQSSPGQMGVASATSEPSGESGSGSSTKSDESTPGVSASFSCERCKESFASREELKQHTIDKHGGKA